MSGEKKEEEERPSKKAKASLPTPINFPQWLKDNEKNLKPPVCNKLMYGGQLKIMFVGGSSANDRTDFHLEEGEELFYQIKGDMCLKTVEQGKHKDIVIKEGEMYLLPPRIPHSPQREKDSIGLVVERDRKEGETDGLRWYVPGTTDVLYEAFFHCLDLGTQLGPEIMRWKGSEACKTGKPNHTNGTILKKEDVPIDLDETTSTVAPQALREWVAGQASTLKAGPANMYRGEDFHVTLYRKGAIAHEEKGEVFLYQLEGSSTVVSGGEARALATGDMVIMPPGVFFSVTSESEGSLRMALTWPTC